jgi:osmotically-inducible protein OsmY
MFISDLSLQQSVQDELEFEPSINGTHIGVAVEKGVVTLSGHVGSYAEKVAAEEAARRVKGVKAIAEEIEVRYPFEKKVADDEIANRAVNILRWTLPAPQDAIQIKVEDGWVTLTGEVDWQFQKTFAEADVRKLSGVVGVWNHIKIRPRVQPTDVKRKIEAALKRSAAVEAENIHVFVKDGGTIELSGKVRHRLERDMAENAAWSVAGVSAVEDRLEIV